VCLGQINILIMEKKQQFHPWSRFLAWWLRYTSKMPEAYKKKGQKEAFDTQTITVCPDLTIRFEPPTRRLVLEHFANGQRSKEEELPLYDMEPTVRRAAERQLLAAVQTALPPKPAA
jgi:uncharacterized protein YbbK (DUF523 family)